MEEAGAGGGAAPTPALTELLADGEAAAGGGRGEGGDDDDEDKGRAADSARVEGESSVAALGCVPADGTVSGVPSAGGPEKSEGRLRGRCWAGRTESGRGAGAWGRGEEDGEPPRCQVSESLGGGGTAGAGECCRAGRTSPS